MQSSFIVSKSIKTMWQSKRWAWIHGLGPVMIAEHYIINQALNSQKIPHIPGWWVSNGVSIVSISDGADAVTCIMRPWITANVWHTHIFKPSWCTYFRSCSVHWWAENNTVHLPSETFLDQWWLRNINQWWLGNINQWWLGNINQWWLKT